MVGSAKTFWRQTAIFFVELSNGRFGINFVTSPRNEFKLYEQNWHYVVLNEDFAQTLRKYGRLPIASNEEGMKLLDDLEESKEANKRLKERIARKDNLMNKFFQESEDVKRSSSKNLSIVKELRDQISEKEKVIDKLNGEV